MKSFIAIIAVLGLFVSCNEESLVEGYNTQNENGGNLIGKWEISHRSKFTNGVQEYSFDITPDCSTQKDYQEFKLDGTGRYYDYNSSCIDNGYAIKWSKLSDKIIYSPSGFTEEILLLDKTTLIVKWVESGTVYYLDTYIKR